MANVVERQTILLDYEVLMIANRHSAKSLSDPSKQSVYTEQFIAAIEDALLLAQTKNRVTPQFICDCGQRGPHLCPLRDLV